ncbi:unnamed protein product [Closterium sp. NIES-65]|nr:unnamed protein product [Closterium sp. NIES-65]
MGAAGGDRSTLGSATAKGAAGGDRSTPERAAARGAAGGDWSTPGSATARGAAGGDRSTPGSATARGAAGGDWSTPGSATARGAAGGDRSTPGNATARGAAGGDRSTPENTAAWGAAGSDRSTPENTAAWGAAGSDRSTRGRAAVRGAAGGDQSTPRSATARGAAGGDRSTPGSVTARGAAGGDRSTPGSATARGAAGGDRSTPGSATNRGAAGGDRSTPGSATARGAAGGDRSTPGSATARGAVGGDRSTLGSATARGAAGGDWSTPERAAARGAAGGDRSTRGSATARGAAGGDWSTPGSATARGAAGGDRSTPGSATARGAAGGDRSTPDRAAARGAVIGRPGAAVGGVVPTFGGLLPNHMRVCRAAEAERRAQALGSTPSLVETGTQERPTPREFGDEAWAGVTSWEWEAFFSVVAVGGRTVRRIPQRARPGVLDALCCVLKRLKSRPGDEAATLLLLAFPRLILAVPPKPGIGQKALIIERLGAFWEGRWRELFDSAMVAARPAVRPLAYTCSDQDPDAIRLSRCRSRCKVGEWSRGLACLTAGELARPSEAMVQSLREKHPGSTSEVPQWVRDFTVDAPQRPPLTADILARTIHTAARASAAGPSGWVTEHLRDTFLTEPSCLSHLLEVFNQWVAGQVPERARPWLAASNLVGLSKPNGDVRPVAIGEVLPRILARALCISLRPTMASYFLPCNQLGAGTRAGVEILTHSFRSALATHPDWCALQIDVANAFNSFHRHAMFEGLRESPFSGLIPFLRVFYGTPSDLYLRAGPFVQSLESARGSRQGDPLGPFLFAFTQQQVMESVTREFRDLLFLSYADDTYILGPAARILEAFGVLRERLEWVGLEVQAHKCRFWEREGGDVERALPLGMQRVEEGLTVVGVPIGEEGWEVTRLRERLRQLQAPLPWLPLLDHPQMASHLLAIAVSARPMYLARTMPPRPEVVEAFRDWDSCLEDCFEQLFPPGTWEHDPDRSRRARMQLHLPVRLGGFGIRAAASLSPLSYVCGWAQAARDIAQLGVAGEEAMFAEYLTTSAGAEFLDPWFAKALEQLPATIRQEMPGLPLCVAAPPLRLFQARQRLLAVEELQKLRRSARDDATLARFTSLQGPGAGAWVSAVPAHSDLTFTAAEWGIAAAIRLGLPIQQLQVAGRCVCGTAYVDPADPHHALRCKHQHGPSRVHDEVKFVVAKISKASGGVVTMEDSVVLQGKRVDVAVRRPMAGEAHALEISVRRPMRASNRRGGKRMGASWLRQQGDAHVGLAVSRGACREDDTVFSAYLLGSLKALIGVALQRAQARVILLREASSMGGINVDLVDREWDDGDAEGGALWVEAPYMVDSVL